MRIESYFSIDAEPDYDPIGVLSDCDYSEDLLIDYKNGSIDVYLLEISLILNISEVGYSGNTIKFSEYLGGCIYSDKEDLLKNCDYIPDMKDTLKKRALEYIKTVISEQNKIIQSIEGLN